MSFGYKGLLEDGGEHIAIPRKTYQITAIGTESREQIRATYLLWGNDWGWGDLPDDLACLRETLPKLTILLDILSKDPHALDFQTGYVQLGGWDTPAIGISDPDDWIAAGFKPLFYFGSDWDEVMHWGCEGRGLLLYKSKRCVTGTLLD